MKYNPEKHRRRSIRLKGFDYSQPGIYFTTIVTQNREMLFGDVVNGKMVLNNAGKIAQKCWFDIPNHYPNVNLDVFIVMPNHVHGIIIINKIRDVGNKIVGNEKIAGAKDFSPLRSNNGNKFRSPSRTIGSIVRGFKIGVTKWFRNNTDIYNVWQRNY